MDTLLPSQIFNLGLAFGVIVAALSVKWYVYPYLKGKSLYDALTPFLLLSTLRFVGLVFLVPGAVAPSLSSEFAFSAAWLDFGGAALALLAVILVKNRLPGAIIATWVFVGQAIADHIINFSLASRSDALAHFGAAWSLPMIFAPITFVSLYMIVWILVHKRQFAYN